MLKKSNYTPWLMVAGLSLLGLPSAFAGQCSPGSDIPAGPVRGACGERPLPEDRIRRLDYNSIRLTCSAGTDSFVHSPKSWDFKAWEQAERKAEMASNNGDRDGEIAARREMQKIAQGPETDIRWSGVLPYSTYETWDWVSCDYGPDEDACGVYYTQEEHCTTTPASTSCTTDSRGNQDCRTTPASTRCYTEQIKHVKSCYHDVPRHEERHCSNERMLYKVEYVRPSQQEWGPGVQGYYDLLPNKYDLLPGEVETVQVASTNGQSPVLTPNVDFGDPWNEYAPSVQFTVGDQRCRYNFTPEIDVKVFTKQRKIKKSPNAFRLPLDPQTKEPIEPLRWVEDTKNVKLKPDLIRMMDTSSEAIKTLARQSRNFDADIAAAKANAGEASNATDKDAQDFKGFWKETQIRVRLVEDRPIMYRNVKVSERIIVSGADVEIDGSTYWVPLMGNADSSDLYRSRGPLTKKWNLFTYNLRPGTKYKMLISMFQKGVPFYIKECGEKGTSSMACTFQGEDAYFSKELPIEFVTDENNDVRGPLQILSDFQGTPFWKKPVELWRIIRRLGK